MTYEVPDLNIQEPLSTEGSNSNGEEEDFKYLDDIVNEMSSAGSLSPEESPRQSMNNHANRLRASLSTIKSPRCLRRFIFCRDDAILGSNDDNTSHKSSENLSISPRSFSLSPRSFSSTGSSRHSSAGSTSGSEKAQSREDLSLYLSTSSSTDSTSLCTRILNTMEKLDQQEIRLKKLAATSGDLKLVIKDDTVLLSMGGNKPQSSLQRSSESINMTEQGDTQKAYLAYLDYVSTEEELAEALGEYEASMMKRTPGSVDEMGSDDMFPKVHAAAVQRLRRNPRNQSL